jgi:hypothetical protein
MVCVCVCVWGGRYLGRSEAGFDVDDHHFCHQVFGFRGH